MPGGPIKIVPNGTLNSGTHTCRNRRHCYERKKVPITLFFRLFVVCMFVYYLSAVAEPPLGHGSSNVQATLEHGQAASYTSYRVCEWVRRGLGKEETGWYRWRKEGLKIAQVTYAMLTDKIMIHLREGRTLAETLVIVLEKKPLFNYFSINLFVVCLPII